MMKKRLLSLLLTLVLALCLVLSMTERAEAADANDYITVFGTKLSAGGSFSGNISGSLSYAGKNSGGVHIVYLRGFQHKGSGKYGIYCPGDLKIISDSSLENSIDSGGYTGIRAEGDLILTNGKNTNDDIISLYLTVTTAYGATAGIWAGGDMTVSVYELNVNAYNTALYSSGDMLFDHYYTNVTIGGNAKTLYIPQTITATSTDTDEDGMAIYCGGDMEVNTHNNFSYGTKVYATACGSVAAARVLGKVTVDGFNSSVSNCTSLVVTNNGTGHGMWCSGGMSIYTITDDKKYSANSANIPVSFVSQNGHGLYMDSNLTNSSGQPLTATLSHNGGSFNVTAYGSKAAMYLENTVVKQSPIYDNYYEGSDFNEIYIRNYGSGNALETNRSLTLKVVDAEAKSGSALYIRGDLTIAGVSVYATNSSSIKSTVTVNGNLYRPPMLPEDPDFDDTFLPFPNDYALRVTNKGSGRGLYVTGSIDTSENTYNVGDIRVSSNGDMAIYCGKDLYVGPHTQIIGETTNGTAISVSGKISVCGEYNQNLFTEATKLRGESDNGAGIYAGGAITVTGEDAILSGASVNGTAIQSARSITLDTAFSRSNYICLSTEAVNGVGLKAPLVELISGPAQINSQLNAIETDQLKVNADTERDLSVVVEVTNLSKDAAYDPENYSALGGCKEIFLTNADATVAPFRDGTYDGAVQLTEKNRSTTNYAYIRVGHVFINGVGARYGDYIYGNMTAKNTAPIHQKNGNDNYVVFTKDGFTMKNFVADNGDATLPLFETQGDMTVTLEGKSVVTSPAGLISGGKLTVKGDGSLTLNTTVGHGFQAKGAVKLESGELKITATGSGLYAPGYYVDVMSKANLDVTGGEYGVVAKAIYVYGAMTARSTNTKLDDVYYAVESSENIINSAKGWRMLGATTPTGTPTTFVESKITTYDYLSVKPYEVYIKNQTLPIPSQDATKYLPATAFTCDQYYRITESKWQTADQVDFEGRFTLGEQYYACYRLESMECALPLGYSLQFFVDGKQLYYDGVNVVVENDSTNQDAWVKVLYECCVNEVAAPKVTVSNKADTGKPYLTWGKVANAAKYEIWRCDTTDAYAYYTKMYTTTSTSYTNTSAEPNVMYYYKVRGLDADGNPGKFSDIYTCVCDCAAPVVKLELNESKQPVLTWEAVKGAVEYDVYRCSTRDGAYTKITTAPILANTLTDVGAEVGKTYYYKVRAYGNNSNANSAYSAIVSSGSDLEAPVITATNRASDGKPVLKWNAVDVAAKYEVYRATSKTGTYSLLKTLTGTSLTNTSAVAGKTYYYKVCAVDANGNKSAFSSIVSRACDLPQPVVTVSNVASTGKIKLSWDKIEGASKYEVYRATSKDGTYTKLTTVTGTSLTNSSAVAGKTYYYKVRAIHGSNTSAHSAYSAIVKRACDLPAPTVKISVVSSTGKLKLTWDEVTGAKDYSVYRSTDGGATYSLLKTTTGTSLTNTSTTAGNMYYYKVKANHTNSSANSAYSSVVKGTCDLPRPTATVSLNSSGKPVVTWEKVSGATKYTVYIYDADGNLLKTSSTTSTKLTHNSAVKGTTYKYRVVAVHSNSAANSAKSTTVSIKCTK